ncbi:LuxR family transcriptional regulator [Paucibacter sp. XJ19-41]|uniref:LuxR family transcriptional regulator n=1 Tax=Paucibacter sp. XJ19-41 TaxID=2927824 RepID=UPI00234A5EF4|nr:LuxR family transcriptional regulator [Paucibacter sp. XJ19-41]MDC6167143.1 LuxR family transcriptional regulator [Paucibacter sp. XJ19-41]
MYHIDERPFASTQALAEVFNELDSVGNVAELKATLGRVCKGLGFDKFLLTMVMPTMTGRYSKFTLTNYPEDWSEIYLRHKYFHVDPVLHHCRLRSTPIDWRDLRCPAAVGLDQFLPFTEQVRQFGLLNGVSVPLRGVGGAWGLLSLNYADTTGAGRRSWTDMATAKLLGSYLQDAVYRLIVEQGREPRKEGLSARETECLHWICAGKTAGEVAQILEICESTVVFHLKNIMRKTDAVNRLQAAVRSSHWLATDPDFFFSNSAAAPLLEQFGSMG